MRNKQLYLAVGRGGRERKAIPPPLAAAKRKGERKEPQEKRKNIPKSSSTLSLSFEKKGKEKRYKKRKKIFRNPPIRINVYYLGRGKKRRKRKDFGGKREEGRGRGCLFRGWCGGKKGLRGFLKEIVPGGRSHRPEKRGGFPDTSPPSLHEKRRNGWAPARKFWPLLSFSTTPLQIEEKKREKKRGRK